MTVSSIGKELLDAYLGSLAKNVSVIPYESGCHLLTPFIRPDGEAIGLEITSLPNGDFRLSDMGDTLGYLYVNGLAEDLAAPDYSHSLAETYAVTFVDNAMTISCYPEDLGDAVHNLIHAVLAVTNFGRGRAFSDPAPANADNGAS